MSATVRGRVRRDGSARDLGYPGGSHRPPRFEEAWATLRDAAERDREREAASGSEPSR
jgi:hypothetical protein